MVKTRRIIRDSAKSGTVTSKTASYAVKSAKTSGTTVGTSDGKTNRWDHSDRCKEGKATSRKK